MTVLAFILLAVLASSYLFLSLRGMENSATAPVVQLELDTDKGTYHSRELMKIMLTIYSSQPIQNATLRIYGLGGRVNMKRNVNLNVGVGEFFFNYTLPACNVCSGIKPGKYNVSCVLSYGNRAVRDWKTVEVRQ